jgi:membrane-associated phospholipid phosphatase
VALARRSRLGTLRAVALRDGAVVVVSSFAFQRLARRASEHTVSKSEEQVFRAVNRLTPSLRRLVWPVMQAGSLPAVAVAAVVARHRSRATAVALAISGTAAWGLCKAVKRIVGRGRPADHLDEVVVHGAAQQGGGFPSGHAAVATTLAAVGARLVAPPAVPVVWGSAAFVCAARTYVGAHLPLDVAGGAALGLSVGSTTNLVLDVLALAVR